MTTIEADVNEYTDSELWSVGAAENATQRGELLSSATDACAGLIKIIGIFAISGQDNELVKLLKGGDRSHPLSEAKGQDNELVKLLQGGDRSPPPAKSANYDPAIQMVAGIKASIAGGHGVGGDTLSRRMTGLIKLVALLVLTGDDEGLAKLVGEELTGFKPSQSNGQESRVAKIKGHFSKGNGVGRQTIMDICKGREAPVREAVESLKASGEHDRILKVAAAEVDATAGSSSWSRYTFSPATTMT